MIVFTGITGSLGRHLPFACAARGLACHALGSRLEKDIDGLRRELKALPKAASACLFHLAARVPVPDCERDPAAAHQINVGGAINVVSEFIDWAKTRSIAHKVIYTSTGHVYQASAALLTETDPVAPRSIYAETKLEAEGKLTTICSAADVSLIIARLFGVVAPIQARQYVLPGLLRRVRAGALSGVPNLDGVRDYLDARDVCGDLLDLGRTPEAGGLVNVCSGQPVRIRHLLELIVRAAEPARAAELIAGISAAPGRADDVPFIAGNPARLMELVGPRPPRIPLEQTVREAVAAASHD